MRGLLANPSLALESIQFQSGQFFKELSIVFAQLQKVADKELPDHELFQQIGAVIKHHTNLTVTPAINSYGPSISLPHLDRNHPLIPVFNRQFYTSSDGVREIQRAGGVVKGMVNLKSGRVDGVFAELPAALYLSVANVKHEGLTAEELAAIVLHEVGHFFVYCEMISRTVTTNYVLANMSRMLDGTEGTEKREMVLMTVKEALRLKELDTKTLATSRNPKVVEAVVVTAVMRETQSELGSNYYDTYGFEYLSDEYAMRQGAGRHLVTALDKTNREANDPAYWSTSFYLIYEALKFAMLLFPPTWVIGFFLTLSTSRSDTHEPPEARTRRIRNQVVEALKAKKLTPAQYAILKEDLVACDQILAQVTDRRNFLEVIAFTVFPDSRREWKQLVLQKELEDLALNDLFVKAQDLKQLA